VVVDAARLEPGGQVAEQHAVSEQGGKVEKWKTDKI
jgi:hypothetical protein